MLTRPAPRLSLLPNMSKNCDSQGQLTKQRKCFFYRPEGKQNASLCDKMDNFRLGFNPMCIRDLVSNGCETV